MAVPHADGEVVKYKEAQAEIDKSAEVIEYLCSILEPYGLKTFLVKYNMTAQELLDKYKGE